MSPAECLTKANQLRADARDFEKQGDEAMASRCRVLAGNLDLMVHDDPKRREAGAELYARNLTDTEEFINKTGRHSPEFKAWYQSKDAPVATNLKIRNERRAG